MVAVAAVTQFGAKHNSVEIAPAVLFAVGSGSGTAGQTIVYLLVTTELLVSLDFGQWEGR